MSGDAAPPRRRVAVLGGGCGGLAAAWTLTATPELRARFEVTVYERSWRLGGKGASGRGSGDGFPGRRIEEHGLHIWFGFYAHAFRMLRDAYAEAGLAAGEDWWRVPFEKCDAVSLYDRGRGDTWIRQIMTLPVAPGPPPTRPRPFVLRRALARAARMVAHELRRGGTNAEPTRGGAPRASGDPLLSELAGTLDDTARTLESAPSEDAVWSAPVEIRRDGGALDPLGRDLRRLRWAATEAAGRLAGDDAGDEVRRGMPRPPGALTSRLRLLLGTVELVAATVAGLRADNGRAPDTVDLRAWLKSHGARDSVVDASPILRGLYDLTFAYRSGDKRAPDLAAGKALQSLLWMIDYEGAFMWRMRAGMGDVVFSPLYLALRQRGVRFRFFSQVTGLTVQPERPLIDRIELTRTARVRKGPDAYEPLERVGEWWCWPARPLADQVADGPGAAGPTSEALQRGADFDDAVLAIPAGALAEICGDLARRSTRFARMLDGTQTVRTKAMQLWLTRPVHELCHAAASDNKLDPPATAYVEPFDTYCDMSHLLTAEGAGSDGPKGVAYFCAVLDDSVPDADAQDHVHDAARRHLTEHARAFWPAAFNGDMFDWNVLYDPEERVGAQRLEAQYLRVNLDGSDRYVRTPAGGVDTRLEPGDCDFDNLALAGDWTHNAIDGGCVEAAVISGVRAGEALVERSRPASAVASLPAFVEFGELATAVPPFVCERLHLYGFIARADPARIRALCDRVLNAPTAGVRSYLPRFAHVLLVFSALDGMRSDAPAHRGLGAISYREAAIWIPVFINGGPRLFMPYLWLDDPIAIATGRELYGFTKTEGVIAGLPDASRPAGALELTVDRVTGAPAGAGESLATRQRLLTVHSGEVVRGTQRPAELGDLSALIEHFLGDGGADRDTEAEATRGSHPARRLAAGFHEFRAGRFRHVQLKQIRDAEHPDRATIQQLVETLSVIDLVAPRRFRLLPEHELTIAMPGGADFAATLGLESPQLTRGFEAEFGFRLEPGTVVWSAR
jgi:uncharacterized protein with NAD-binding domain and iron-sulfur cluster